MWVPSAEGHLTKITTAVLHLLECEVSCHFILLSTIWASFRGLRPALRAIWSNQAFWKEESTNTSHASPLITCVPLTSGCRTLRPLFRFGCFQPNKCCCCCFCFLPSQKKCQTSTNRQIRSLGVTQHVGALPVGPPHGLQSAKVLV